MLDVLKESEHKMKMAIEVLKTNFSGVRTGRANPSLLDQIKVSYYGTECPLKQLASISVPEPRQLMVTPFDKNSSAEIEKAILKSDLGIHPKREANVIRLMLPEPTEERRKELVKMIKKESEDAKVAVRNVRREALDSAKKQKSDKKITEDDEKDLDKKIQVITDNTCKDIDSLFAAKEKEVMEV
ncbi:MAG: ribosome recycling factor [bacterium]